MPKANYEALNAIMDRIDARTGPVRDPLERVKIMVEEFLKHPDADEETRRKILTEMESGGYESLLRMFTEMKIPDDFNPNERPWNKK